MGKHRQAFRLSAAVVFATACSAAHATIYNAAGDFSASNNPNGVWSFGEQATLGTGFSTFGASGNVLGFDYWTVSSAGNLNAIHNSTASGIYYGGSVLIDPGQLVLHPNLGGEYTLARFTAPTAGTYTFSANFIGQDYVYGTTTDVHLLVNNVAIFSSVVIGYHNTASSGIFSMVLAANDTIDAAVGWGNNDFYGDTTGLEFTVESVPAPGPLALALLAFMLRRRQRA